MPPLHRQTNLANVPTRQLAAQLHQGSLQYNWNNVHQQYVFARAMELYNRPNANLEQRRLVRRVLGVIAAEGSAWENNRLPPARFATNNNNYNSYISNSNSNPSAGLVYGSNSNSNMNNQASAPNYSKASGALKKWLAARPHTIYQNVVQIKLPKNAEDPVSYKNFKAGNEAVMVVKKRLLSNGAMRSRRTFYNKNTIERLAQGKKWRTILRMKGSDAVFKDPINRRTVYRRDLMNVKFV